MAEIPDPEWKRMWKVAGAADRKLLEGCYRKDANALPATWLLTAAGKDLLPALRRAAGAADIQGFARVKYFASATVVLGNLILWCDRPGSTAYGMF